MNEPEKKQPEDQPEEQPKEQPGNPGTTPDADRSANQAEPVEPSAEIEPPHYFPPPPLDATGAEAPERASPVQPSSPRPQPVQPQPVQPQPGYTPPPPAPHRSFVFPVLLIFLGGVFLAQNLGLIQWTIWEVLWRFWPVWLIALGVDLLFGRRSRAGSIIALALVITLLAGGSYYFHMWTGFATSWSVSEPTSITQPASGLEQARVEIQPAVSRLVIRGGANPGALLSGTVTPVPGERIEQSDRMSGTTGYYRIASQFDGPNLFPGRAHGGGDWNLRLSNQIPMALIIQPGVGRAEIDLREVNLTDLRINTGVGETTVTLPATGRFRGRIETGVGSTTIRIPEGVAARVKVSTGIGGISVGSGFESDGSYYVIGDWERAAHRIELDVNGGVGAIRLTQVR